MNVLIIQGHPDPTGKHLCHALADAYRRGAESAGHAVETIDVGATGVGFLRSEDEFGSAESMPDYARTAQAAISRAEHLVFVFPLWLGGMPALLKAWLEQAFRNEFAFVASHRGVERRLKGKSARLVVTMGMPAPVFRLYFAGHGTGVLRRSILGLAGVRPIRQSLVGAVGARSRESLAAELAKLERLGRDAR